MFAKAFKALTWKLGTFVLLFKLEKVQDGMKKFMIEKWKGK